MSERTLQRRIHEHFGLSISDWLKHKKMKYALHALLNTTLSIGEISEEKRETILPFFHNVGSIHLLAMSCWGSALHRYNPILQLFRCL
ncbi:AraC family transcriptional regulator [Pelistega sp. NLN82]|uniref:AraC family transcriptional regulator n=1 Tax=Pelistega ratti TaxID=2652177 RepID=A0A6L9Y3Q8_9BURK|nr:AraC family transcriptional regulator [Pelistega ratti]